MKKVLASDFDGTLMFDGKFRDDDLIKIRDFQQKGHLFGLCSGRPLQGMEELCDGQIAIDFYILCSGALVLDKNYQVIDKQTVSQDLMYRFFQQYGNDYPIYIQANYKIYTFEKKDIPGMVMKHILTLDEVDGDIYGFSMYANSEENASMISSQIEMLFPKLSAHQNKEFIDVTKKGCSKGSGIEIIKKAFSISNIAGIGDSYNDIPMLETVDQAFTFHSSPAIVKKTADHVVDSVHEAIDILLENEDV